MQVVKHKGLAILNYLDAISSQCYLYRLLYEDKQKEGILGRKAYFPVAQT
jgi:hypothetical protein